MTNIQLYISIGVPLLFNGVIFIILLTSFNGRLTDLRAYIDQRFNAVDQRFASLERVMDAKFEAAHQQLLRVEGVIDARLTRLEEERHGK